MVFLFRGSIVEEKSVGGTPNQVAVLLQQSLEDCTRASEVSTFWAQVMVTLHIRRCHVVV